MFVLVLLSRPYSELVFDIFHDTIMKEVCFSVDILLSDWFISIVDR